jgi:hypothetical protein
MNKFHPSAHGVTFTVKVAPRASRTQIEGWYEHMLKVRLHAPPVDGKANAALIALLAETFDIHKGNIVILSGETSRQKLVRVTGLSAEQIRMRLESLIGN